MQTKKTEMAKELLKDIDAIINKMCEYAEGSKKYELGITSSEYRYWFYPILTHLFNARKYGSSRDYGSVLKCNTEESWEKED